MDLYKNIGILLPLKMPLFAKILIVKKRFFFLLITYPIFFKKKK